MTTSQAAAFAGLLVLVAGPAFSDEAYPLPAPAAGTQGAASWTALDGPAHLTLGAEAYLELPEGWRFVSRDRLGAYLGGSGRSAGNWDLGVALGPDSPSMELRLQFEPMGAVDDSAGLEEPLALLARIQQAASDANVRRRLAGQGDLLVTGWSQPPAYELAVHRLLFGELRTQGGEDWAAWRLRLPGRDGVLKIDLLEPAEALSSFSAQAAELAANLSFQPGRGLDERLPADKPAGLDLNGLVLRGVLGRGGSGGVPRESIPVGVLAAVALALAFGAVRLLRELTAWREARDKAERKERESRDYERSLGSSADDVVEINEDEGI